MKKLALLNRFGEVTEIVKDEWVREVTEGSKSCFVLVHLYQDGLIECQVMDEALRDISKRFRYLKCLRIKSNQAIENWPEKNLPTLFIYAKGELRTQIITLASLGGNTMTSQGKDSFCFLLLKGLIACFVDLEWYLGQKGIIHDSELDENPRNNGRKGVEIKKGGGLRSSHYDSDENSDS
jgi:hypothetical protein